MRKIILFSLILAFAACTVDNYDVGDGDYSYMRADFGLFDTDNVAKIHSFKTDGGKDYSLVSAVSVTGMKADTTYRALIYYDSLAVGQAKMRGLVPVGVVKLRTLSEVTTPKTDPLHFESIWLSQDGSYINLSLKLMVGNANGDDSHVQQLGMMKESSEAGHHRLLLLHAQNGAPEYYSHTTYVSIPVEGNFQKGDEVTIRINTYGGITEKTILLR